MPGLLLLHVGAGMSCPHAAPATVAPSQTRVLVTGQPVALFTGMITVAGCPFQIPVGPALKPQPCVTVKWLLPSARIKVMTQPVAMTNGPGTGPALALSIEQIPQGPPIIAAVQLRVSGL